jgi:hypothetical protein
MMLRRRATLLIFLVLLALWALLLAPALVVDGYLDSPMGLLLLVPFLSIYLFNAMGISGVLESNGACGWGWCAPTGFGWALMAAVWLGLTYGLAALISRVFVGRSAPDS